jgi:hypothetical protein
MLVQIGSASTDRPTRSCCDDQLNPPNIPRSNSVAAAVMPACAPRWARSATPTTTPCARVSSPPSNASCLHGADSRHRLRRDMRSSNSSKASTIDDDAIPRSDISHRSIMSGGIQRPRSIPTHTSLPPCSRPSRTSPSGGPKKGPSLTAAVRDGRTIVRAGTEEWLRPEPNQRMSRSRRPTCRQIR